MVRTVCSYPAILEPDEDGRLLVHFPGLPEALTDGADEAEALREAADCLSEALASRIVDGEEIPTPTPLAPGQHLVSPDPTIALKAALYTALRRRDMTVADLAELLEMDWHLAARLIDPKRSSKLTSLAAALGALGCRISISVEDSEPGPDIQRWLGGAPYRRPPAIMSGASFSVPRAESSAPAKAGVELDPSPSTNPATAGGSAAAPSAARRHRARGRSRP
jgi:antitoxin HicB